MADIYIIAEIGQAHEGSIGIAHSYIDALKDTGVNAVKFQAHIAEAESSIYEPFRVKFSYKDRTRYDYWKRMEFTEEEWVELKQHCNNVNLEFICSPFSNAAVDLLEKVGVNKYKVGSGEVSNLLLIEKIALTGKDIILSSGLSSLNELQTAISLVKKYKNNLSILQCTTEYPTKSENWGLNMIGELKNYFNVPIGFSDHSGEIYACLAAAALGAEILEFHVVFDKRMFGPDSLASLSIDEIRTMVKGIRAISTSINNPQSKEMNSEKQELKNIFEKSLSVNKDLPKGHILKFDDLESKKPKNYGINAKDYRSVIGEKINKNLKKWDFLNEEDLLKNE